MPIRTYLALYQVEASKRTTAKLPRAATAMALVLIGLSSPTCVQAQEVVQDAASAPKDADTDSKPVSGSEIVVTAQRRAERLQDVPIAISALGSDSLEKRGIVDLSSLRGSIPSLTISGFAGVNASNLVSIRGVSGQALAIGASQATAIYLDGVFLPRSDAAFFVLDDMERIEVLRGPQGTLYGRNATAGAINIVTRAPGKDLEGGVNVSYGNYDSISARGFISSPLTSNLSAGLSASYEANDGYFTNTVTGNRVRGRDALTTRAKLRYDNGAGFDALVSGDYSRIHAHGFYKNLYDGGVLTGIGDPKFVSTDVEDFSGVDTDIGGAALTMNFKISDSLTLTSISSWRTLKTVSMYDGDGSAVPALRVYSVNNSDTLNQELRAMYDGGSFRFTVGGNYFREKADLRFQVNPGPVLGLNPSPFDTSELDALAAFGQFEYDLAEKLTVVGGLRFNYEKRKFSIDYSKALPTPGLLLTGQVSDDILLPSFGLNYKPSRDVLLFVKFSKGYQAPGFNPAPGARTTIPNIFGAETLNAYEVGLKSQFLDRRITLNLAGFFYDYKDMQVRSSAEAGVISVLNAASATAKGVEAEMVVRLTPNLTFSGHVTHAQLTYDKYCEPLAPGSPQADDPLCSVGVADRSGNYLNQAPRWSGGVNVDFTKDVAEGYEFNANLSYSFESKVFFTAANEVPGHNGWHRLDLRAGLTLPNGVEVFAYGRNLTDDRYVAYANRFNPTIVQAAISDPRTYGFGVKYRF